MTRPATSRERQQAIGIAMRLAGRSPVAVFAEDAKGHEHKGKGEGGGQFTAGGGGGGSGDSKGGGSKTQAINTSKGARADVAAITKRHGGDKKKAAQELVEAINAHSAAHGQGKIAVSLYGKEVPVVGIKGSRIRTANGHEFDLGDIGDAGGHVVFHPAGQSQPQPQPKSVPVKPPPDQNKILADVRRGAHDRDMNDPMQSMIGVNLKDHERVPSDIADQFDAHGTADLQSLTKLLNGGIDPNREFYTSPLTGAYSLHSGHGVTVRDNSAFVVLGHPGQTLKNGGIAAVIVDELHAPYVKELEKAFPGVKFFPSKDTAKILPKVTKPGAPKVSYHSERFNPASVASIERHLILRQPVVMFSEGRYVVATGRHGKHLHLLTHDGKREYQRLSEFRRLKVVPAMVFKEEPKPQEPIAEPTPEAVTPPVEVPFT